MNFAFAAQRTLAICTAKKFKTADLTKYENTKLIMMVFNNNLMVFNNNLIGENLSLHLNINFVTDYKRL